MQNLTKEISKETYDKVMTESNGTGRVPESMETELFDRSILCGYGLYGAIVKEDGNQYLLNYRIGDSCD